MQILVVVRQRKHVVVSSEAVPVEVYVAVGKLVRHVGHARTVHGVLNRRATDHDTLVVLYVHLREVAAYAEPTAEVIAQGKVVSGGLHLAVVLVKGALTVAA